MSERVSVALSMLEYELLRRLIRDSFGLDYPPPRRDLLRTRLATRLRALSLSNFSEYYRVLRYTPEGDPEWKRLAECVTNNETYFFREHHQFVALSQVAARLAAVRPAPLRVLSAGCSSGEETYSLAAVLASAAIGPKGGWSAREHPPLSGRPKASPWEVIGIDLSGAKVAQAAAGRYSERSFRGEELPPGLDFERFFEIEPSGAWAVRAALRSSVRFECANLMDARQLSRLGAFDVVFCRNVLIYADAESLPRFAAALASLMTPGAYLFLGPCESFVDPRAPFRRERIGTSLAYVHEP